MWYMLEHELATPLSLIRRLISIPTGLYRLLVTYSVLTVAQ
jgi:hypothetical protein